MELREIRFTPPFKLASGIYQHKTGKTEDQNRSMPTLANVTAVFGTEMCGAIFRKAILVEGMLLPEEEFLLNTTIEPTIGVNSRLDLTAFESAKSIFAGLDWKKIILSAGVTC